jgi:hypothetical protein
VIIPGEHPKTGRFGEMVLETNRGRWFFVTDAREKAVRWLING